MNRCWPPREETISFPATYRTMKGKEYQAFLLSSYLGPAPPLSLLYREYRKTKRGKKGDAVSADGTGPK
jgi:hypothetical protein